MSEHLYASLEELKADLGIGLDDHSHDARLEECLEAASRWIDAECGRVFYTSGTALVPQTRYFTATKPDRLLVDDLLTLSTLKSDDDRDGTAEQAWTATDYRLYPRNAALHEEPYTEVRLYPQGDYTFPVGVEDGVEIAGVWGYWTSVPVQVQAACRREAARRYRLQDALFGVAGSSEFGTQQASAYDPEVRKDLDAFRRLVVG